MTGNDNLRAFERSIGVHLVAGAKRALLASLVLDEPAGGPSKDLVPVAGVRALARAAKARAGLTWTAVEAGADVSARDLTPSGTNPQKTGFTRATVSRLASYFADEELTRLADSDVLWDRVEAIEYLGEMRTYDLEVADTHNFVANDVIVHNSHSVAYSIVAYHTAYLKAHYPADFMAALLSSCIGDTDSVVKYINEARELGIEILPPDVNESGYKFTVVGEKKVRFGLGAIRNVGRGAIDSILAAHAKGPFTSLFEFCERVDLRACNRRVFEALVASGALDGLGGHRAQYWQALDTAIQEASLKQEDAAVGQGFLFGGGPAESRGPKAASQLPNVAPMPESERLTREKEILGFYISGHPLEPFRMECELFASHTVSQLGQWTEAPVTLGVVITAIKRQLSKKTGAEFARLTVEDFSGSSEVLVFPESWGLISDRVRTDVPMLLKGGYSKRDQGAETPTFIVESVEPFAEKRLNGDVAIAIELTRGDGTTASVLQDVRAVIDAHATTSASAPALELRWSDGNGTRARLRSRSLKLAASQAALLELRALLGTERVRLVRGT